MEYYCMDENYASRTLSPRFIGCQNAAGMQLQNLKVLSTFQGHKNPHGQNCSNLIFYQKRQRYVDITRTKVSLRSHHSNINLKMTVLIKLYY